MNVVERTVKRFYVDGRGFASRMKAYCHVAKRELEQQAIDVGRDIEGVHAFYAEKFPLHPMGSFPYRRDGDHLEENDPRWEPHHNRAFCNGCRWDWIRARARELIAATNPEVPSDG